MDPRYAVAERRSSTSTDPSKFIRGYWTGRQHSDEGRDTYDHLQLLTAQSDFAQGAGYIEGLAAGRRLFKAIDGARQRETVSIFEAAADQVAVRELQRARP